MSGIAAIFRTDGGDVDPAMIESMTAAMAYRGPDAVAHWVHGPIAMGHCMLRTTSESLEETQPLANEDGSVLLVLDGYLTNWQELRHDLLQHGARLRNRSDAELVLRAYEAWGEDCSQRIDGEFAFMIWDARRRMAFCAKDHQGLRPLFYHWDGSVLVVASDVGGVLAALPDMPDLNLAYLAEVVANQWYTRDQTAWRGVMRLISAHCMTVRNDGLQLREYWTLPVEVTITYRRDEEYVEHYREMLADCVRRMSRSHLPLAVEVSGGLDSSAVFSLADWHVRRGSLLAPDIQGYTLTGPPDSPADEIGYARAAAEHVGRSIEEVPLFMPGLAWFDERAKVDRDLTIYPNGAMSVGIERAIVANGSRVCLTGSGGDQWLDGTRNYYREQLLAHDWRGLAASARDDAAMEGWPRAGLQMVRQVVAAMLPRPMLSAFLNARDMKREVLEVEVDWLTPDMQQVLKRRRRDYEAEFDKSRMWDYKRRVVKSPYQLLAYDMMGRQRAQNGVEYRNPMLMKAFIEFSAATPERMRRRGGVKKYIHRKAMAGLLPDQIVGRLTKADFSTPFATFAEELSERLTVELPDQTRELVEAEALARLVKKYRSAAIDGGPIWEVWGIYAYVKLLGLQSERSMEGNSR